MSFFERENVFLNMKKKNGPFYILVFLLLTINLYFYLQPTSNKSDVNLEKTSSEVALNSDELLNAFIANEEESNKIYAGKIIEVTGFVQKITFLNNRNTVILYGKNNSYGIICDMNSSQIEKVKKLQEHQKVSVKGICKGFLKDVILLNCYIKIHE